MKFVTEIVEAAEHSNREITEKEESLPTSV